MRLNLVNTTNLDAETLDVNAVIEDWIIEKNGIPHVKLAVITRETLKAYFIDFGDKQVWIPKSVIKFVERKEKPLCEVSS